MEMKQITVEQEALIHGPAVYGDIYYHQGQKRSDRGMVEMVQKVPLEEGHTA